MDILIKSLIVSLFCVGLRMVSSKEMILHFLRVPYEWVKSIKNPNKLNKLLVYLMKPIIGCVTCMSSVWSLVISHFYFGGINKWTILIIFVSSCLNTLIYTVFEKVDNYGKAS